MASATFDATGRQVQYCSWPPRGLVVCPSNLMPSRKAILVILALAASGEARAAPNPSELVTETDAQRALTLALKNIHNAVCGHQKKCAPTTDNELAHPPVSIDDARRAMTVGVFSGVAEKCGLEWENSYFRPLMAHFRHTAQFNPRQLALIATVHGIQQSVAHRSVTADFCTPERKRLLSKPIMH